MEDKVWFTYKARIQAQLRLSRMEFHSQLLLVWYALLSAGLSIITVRYPQALGKETDILSALLGIALLGVSMAVANRDFRGRAIAMRQNYLELQRLYDQIRIAGIHSASDLAQYHTLLASAENHTDTDDKLFRVLNRASLNNRKPSHQEIAEAYTFLAGRMLAITALYTAPIFVWLLF